jgi:hypothetical protein
MSISTGKFSFEAIEKVFCTETKWKNVQSTMSLAFNGIFETLKLQEDYIKELELQISNKPSRHELKAELADKATIQEISDMLSHHKSIIDAKFLMIDDKINLSDVQKLLINKANYEEVKNWLENKASVKDMNSEIDAVYAQIDKVYQSISESLSKLNSIKDIENFSKKIDAKPSLDQVEDIVNKKIESVSKALKAKVDKNDLVKKADLSDIKTIIGLLETKADRDFTDKANARLDKLEKNEAFSKKKFEKYIKESIEDIKTLLVQEIDNEISNHILEVNKHLKELSHEIDSIRKNPLSNLPQLEYLKEKINKNGSWFEHELEDIKDQIKDLQINYKNELSLEKANAKDVLYQKIESTEINLKDLEKEIRTLYKEFDVINNYFPVITSIEDKFNKIITVKIKDLTNTCLGNFDEIKAIKEIIIKKAEAADVETLIHEKNKMIISNLHEIREEIKYKLQSIQSDSIRKSQELFFKMFEDKKIDSLLNQKSDKQEIDTIINILNQKLDANRFESMLEELQSIKMHQEQQYSSIKSNQEDFNIQFTADYTDKINSFILELREKTWTKDIFHILDSKPNIEEVNTALITIQNEMDEKLSSLVFNKFIEDNEVIVNTLCSEICLGRWLWKTGNLKENIIVWDEENTNTNPLLFIWEPKRNFILVEESGIYEVSFGIFSKGLVQLIVNNQEILSIEKKKDTDYNGISKNEFLILSSRSRVSLKFIGDSGQGFMSLKKL